MKAIAKIENAQLKKEVPNFNVGDTVKVSTRVKEGEKERIQNYSGIVIGKKGSGINATFTVRRISYGEGVERVFPVHSPYVEKVTVETQGKVRRASLGYLRKSKGTMEVKTVDRKTARAKAAAAAAK
ncbi:MAG: 50S ribosomal protein L19 [Verrucomicrobiales bacterium]|jgi:large subunit ribosomal protein L19|nr:50S ribosomal protein L19 [Verrucomicrobiales bacterium]